MLLTFGGFARENIFYYNIPTSKGVLVWKNEFYKYHFSSFKTCSFRRSEGRLIISNIAYTICHIYTQVTKKANVNISDFLNLTETILYRCQVASEGFSVWTKTYNVRIHEAFYKTLNSELYSEALICYRVTLIVYLNYILICKYHWALWT